MNEIKAFIRPDCIEAVIHALNDAGLDAMTIIPVQALGVLADPDDNKFSPALIERYSNVFKLEIVCRERDVDRALHLIQKLGCTGAPGDGIVYVSPVTKVVKIRNGAEGATAVDGMRDSEH